MDVSGAAQAITPSNRASAATNKRDLRKSTDRLERLPGTTPILTASIVPDSQQEERRPRLEVSIGLSAVDQLLTFLLQGKSRVAHG